MRNLLFSLLGVMIFFASCSKDDVVETPSVKQQNERFYGVKTPELAQSRGVAQRRKLWYPGTRIDIKFLNGSQLYQEKVKQYAAEWEEYAFIFFNFIEEGDADVRIAFDSKESQYITWSTIGTDCKMVINQSEATMNFVDWNFLSEKDIKGDVLRAFGQALGLELEHRHLNFDAGWQANIASYWENTFTDMSWEQLKKLVIDPLESSQILETDEYDVESIMIWPFPRQFATNTARDFNYELSAKDIEFIAKVYPKEEVVNEVVASFSYTNWSGIDKLEIVKDVVIDWGDGTFETLEAGEYTDLGQDKFSTFSQYVKIYGDKNTIVSLSVRNALRLDLSKSEGLKSLSLDFFSADVLDLNKNVNLENLSAASGYYANIYISKCAKLETLRLLGSRELTAIDLSGCIGLKTVDVNSCALTSLDFSNCARLEVLRCYDNQLLSLDVSKCANLSGIYAFNNNLTSLDLSECTQLAVMQVENNPLSDVRIAGYFLELVNVSNTPILEDETRALNFVESLPGRMGAPTGIFYVTHQPAQNIKDLIYPVLESKNWMVY